MHIMTNQSIQRKQICCCDFRLALACFLAGFFGMGYFYFSKDFINKLPQQA